MNAERAKSWLKILIPFAFSILGLTTLRLLGPDILDQKTLSDFIRPLGKGAPAAFIAMLALRPFTLLPGQIFTAVGGMLFGTLHAAIYALMGDFLAVSIIFFVSRRYGQRLMKRIAKDRYPALKRAAKRYDLSFAVVATISPIIPTDVAVAAAAASGARYRSIIGGTMLGTAPGVILTAQFGSALSQGKLILTTVSAAGLVVSLIVGVILGRRIAHEVKSESDEQARQPAPARAPRRRLARERAGTMPAPHGYAPVAAAPEEAP